MEAQIDIPDAFVELWKDVVGYEGLYQVSNLGRVRSLPNSHHLDSIIMRQSKGKVGYMRVPLAKNKTHRMKLVHRLVAEAFIPNPKNKPQVNHKNGRKDCNIVSNLEWATRSENQKHAYRELGRVNKGGCRPRPIICVEMGRVFESVIQASRVTGIDQWNIGSVASHRPRIQKGRVYYKQTAGGYHWRYIDGN